MTKEYLQSIITLPAAVKVDLYDVHQRVMALTGNKAITYSPDQLGADGGLMVVLRATPGTLFCKEISPELVCLEKGQHFSTKSAIRIVKRSDQGERLPNQDEAMDKCFQLLKNGGFNVDHIDMKINKICFHHDRLAHQTCLPFWSVSSTLTVSNAEKAAQTMVRGVGRNRGLGFGMLMMVGGVAA